MARTTTAVEIVREYIGCYGPTQLVTLERELIDQHIGTDDAQTARRRVRGMVGVVLHHERDGYYELTGNA